jgi:site-specific DNA recombinase
MSVTDLMSVMRIAVYVRVSSQHQAQVGTIEQQIDRLQVHCENHSWPWQQVQVFRDDGYSGASLKRPGLERLRDQIAHNAFERLLVTAPDRLARKYVHQVLLLEELEGSGCQVEFVERPMSSDPHDQLLLQIRGAVAEYERTLIAERMRRGRLQKYQAGSLLPWGRVPYGYQVNPDRPRDPDGVRLDETEASHIMSMFSYYLQAGQSILSLGRYLQDLGIPAPKGGRFWSPTSLRGILTNPVYTGVVYAGTERSAPKRRRHSRLQPVGRRTTTRPVPQEEWIRVGQVPPIITQEQFDLVQHKLGQNQRFAARNNTAHQYLLRSLVSCGLCRGACFARSQKENQYYCCRRKQPDQIQQGRRCDSRFIPAKALDEMVWQDLSRVLQTPELITAALRRAQNGEWLPQELQSRRNNLCKAQNNLQNQLERLTEAYLASVLSLEEYKRRRADLQTHQTAIETQARQLETTMVQQVELTGLAQTITEFCQRVAQGLETASFKQKRQLVELLIDCVVVTGEEVEIRYVIPTSPKSEQVRFCQLLTDYSGAK